MSKVVPHGRGNSGLAKSRTSRWSTVVEDGLAWLVTPSGEKFYSVGINVVDGGQLSSKVDDSIPGHPGRYDGGGKRYVWTAFHGSINEWVDEAQSRMEAWGFNTAGAWSLPPRILKKPTIIDLEIGRASRFHWFDPFNPAIETAMREKMAELVAPYRNDPLRIGYFSDNEVGWWGGALFAHFSRQPGTSHSKQHWVQALREWYAGNWAQFSADFIVTRGVESWTDLLNSEHQIRLRAGGGGIQIVERWTYLVAARYYEMTARLLREADPGALFFGDRLPIYYDPAAVRAMAPHVDVVATNYNVDSHDGWVARYYFDGLRRLTGGKPVLISEWFFAANENRSGARNNGHLMTVGTQAERAAGAAEAIRQFAAIPEVVGHHWFQFHDHPEGGRSDGEDYNFGLVDLDNQPYEELLKAVVPLNRNMPDLRAREVAARTVPARPIHIPWAQITVGRRSLRDWPKPASLLPPLAPSPGAVAFGEAYATWSERGMAFALIAQEYHDIDLFDHPETFPLGEAFRLEIGLDAGQGPRWFSLYFIPPSAAERDRHNQAYLMRALLCEGPAIPRGDTALSPVPGCEAVYFGSDQPRITAQMTIPWASLGIESLPENRRITLEVVVTAWHGSRSMSLTGLSSKQGLMRPETWETVTLDKR
jgi:hypothetical protein